MAEKQASPLLAPPEYDDFVAAVKAHVCLDILIKAIQRDRQQMPRLKFLRLYQRLLEGVAELAEREIRRVRARMRKLGGQIVQEVQEPLHREVHVRFRGFCYTQPYMNAVLKNECEGWFERLLMQWLQERLEGVEAGDHPGDSG